MAKVQLLLDTNAYLRLAEKLNPLLNTPFGPAQARLFVIRDFEEEFKRSARLQSNFAWVMDRDFVLNRRKHVRIPRDKRRTIDVTTNALVAYVRDVGLAVSRVDNSALAIGRAMGIPVVTDDRDMRKVAHEFKIDTMRSLALLRRMERVGYIDMDKVRSVAIHWQRTDDRPPNFISDYRRIFGERHPNVPRRRSG